MDNTIVVGGGIIGLSIAYELARRGRKVSVVERGEMGRQASWAGVGILPPGAVTPSADPLDQLRSLSHRLHAEWAERLRVSTGIDTGFRRSGGIYLARTAGEAATLIGTFGWWQEQGIEARQLSIEELERVEPALTDTARFLHKKGIWLLPDECQVRTPRHVQALVAACQALGVELLPNCDVTKIEAENGRVVRIHSNRGTMQASDYCIASGPWLRHLLEPLGWPTGVLPIRGQVLLFRSEKNIVRHIINEGHRYCLPREDGQILVGSNEEEVGFEVATTPEVLEELSNWAYDTLPALRSAKIERSWAGLRPGSFDGLPYIGPLPDLENCFVAGGHYRSGIHLSCATAKVIADLILDRTTSIDLFSLRPGRG